MASKARSVASNGAATLAGHWGPWGLAVGLVIALFEALTVLVLRAHYTMDVFTGALAAFLIAAVTARLAPPCDRLLARP